MNDNSLRIYGVLLNGETKTNEKKMYKDAQYSE